MPHLTRARAHTRPQRPAPRTYDGGGHRVGMPWGAQGENAVDGWGRAHVPLDLHTFSLRRIRQLGFAGSCLLVVGSLLAGVLPWQFVLQVPSDLLHLRTHVFASVALVFVGVS